MFSILIVKHFSDFKKVFYEDKGHVSYLEDREFMQGEDPAPYLKIEKEHKEMKIAKREMMM